VNTLKKVRKQVWLAASAVVIAGNLYLTFKEDSKADRTEWLHEWDRASTGDVVQSFSTKGVVVPSDEYPIYFDASIGSLEQVLVKEGDAIQPGTSLFKYSSTDIDEEIDRLTTEKEQTQHQISLIDNQLSQLRVLLSQAESEESSTQTSTNTNNTNDRDGNTTVINSGDASTTIENEILQQETEKQKLQEETKKYDKLIASQEAIKSNLIVKSTNEGYVKKINKSLNNPLLIISSSVPAVQGVFDEKQVQKAEAGQRVEVTVDTTAEQFDGSLGIVGQYPEEEPSVKHQSLYPFSAQLSGIESSDLYPGLKANVKVVTAEELEAVTIPGTSILKSNKETYAVIMNVQGKLERRTIETDLNVDGVFQVTGGVESGEAIVINPHDLVMKRGPFITPIDTDTVKKKTFNELSRTEKMKYVLIGVLS
jgi:HlyD family secretion protein